MKGKGKASTFLCKLGKGQKKGGENFLLELGYLDQERRGCLVRDRKSFPPRKKEKGNEVD